MFKGLSQACDIGYHWSEQWGNCVLDDPDIIVDVPGTAPMSDTTKKYLVLGVAAFLLLGAFMGGRRSSRGSKRSGMLLSRTTTRSIFG